MGILDRSGDIARVNINDLIAKGADPEKVIDDYLGELAEALLQVKADTQKAIDFETRSEQAVAASTAEIERFTNLAKQALQAGNEDDARVFLMKKRDLEQDDAELRGIFETARQNADKMRNLHDTIVDEIEELKARRASVEAKMATASAQTRVAEFAAGAGGADNAIGAFATLEAEAQSLADRADALEALSRTSVQALEEKYAAQAGPSIDDELGRLKADLGL